jgi:hypothetical protein
VRPWQNHFIFSRRNETVVATRARWRLEILSYFPWHFTPIPVTGFGEKDITMFAFFVNIPGGNVWLKVTL